MRTHQDLDARSLELHKLIVDKIRQDPRLIERVSETLTRWKEGVSPASQPYLNEWEKALTMGLDRCLALAVEESEQANALRQASPFTGILSHRERFKFLKNWSETHAA